MNEGNVLRWEQVNGALIFSVYAASGEAVPVSEWGCCSIRLESGSPGCVAPLLGLLEDGDVISPNGVDLRVENNVLAQLDEVGVAQLGLPNVAPLRLRINGSGILTSPSFRFKYQLVKEDGRPPMRLERQGVVIRFGGKSYTLIDPLYSLVEGMDRFNAMPPEDMDDRMLVWADLKPLLPEGAAVDNSLRLMNIVRADAFTLDLNDAGGFSPQLLHQPIQSQADVEYLEREPGKPFLPDQPQKEFSTRFLQQSQVKRHYTASGNWFVVIPPRLQKALQVVREYQDAPYAERLAFTANPTEVLKERLKGQFEEDEIESFFEETPEFLSARIERLGVWEAKTNAYILPTGQKWFPDEIEALGVIIGSSVFQVAAKDLESVAKGIEQAKEEGKANYEYKGQSIPATDEAVETIKRAAGARREDTDIGEEADESAPTPPKRQVPLLKDNVENVEFEAESRSIRGKPGGLPKVLKTHPLYDYQQAGVEWLQQHWAEGSTGALLADDMGLGKTIQTLAFLAWVQEQMNTSVYKRKPLLIVAPTGLLKNWEDEVRKHLNAEGLGELFRAYGKDLAEIKGLSHNQRKSKLERADWVVTTYETLRDKIRYFLPIDWGVLAFDEAQKIKNPASRLTEMAKSLQVDFTIALTGTPVENRLSDLWSIVDAIAPGQLGSLREFHSQYETQNPEENKEAIGELRQLLTEAPKPVRLLRRMKVDHLDGMPEKREHLIEEQMPPEQAATYSAIISAVQNGAVDPMTILQLLQDMRRVSLIPEKLGPEGITDEVVAKSARLKTLVKILDDIHKKGHKALVFVEFLEVQDGLLPYLQKRYQLPWLPLKISGKIDGHKRKEYVDIFQERPRDQFDVMLLSPKAGGVGLTLTAANHVIHLSRWWNPAVEDQCTDRAFRIGQERPVDVYYLLAVHPGYPTSSFDVNLHQLLERKRALSHELLAPPSASKNDLHNLFNATVKG